MTPATAIYLPASSIGGIGSVIFLSASRPVIPAWAAKSLEASDVVPIEPTRDWLVGVWILAATPDDVERWACNSGALEAFEDSGRWDYFYGEGSWDLSENILKKKVLSFWDGDLKVGDSFAQQIKRLGPDEGATLVDGHWQHMLRCRPKDFIISAR